MSGCGNIMGRRKEKIIIFIAIMQNTPKKLTRVAIYY